MRRIDNEKHNKSNYLSNVIYNRWIVNASGCVTIVSGQYYLSTLRQHSA